MCSQPKCQRSLFFLHFLPSGTLCNTWLLPFVQPTSNLFTLRARVRATAYCFRFFETIYDILSVLFGRFEKRSLRTGGAMRQLSSCATEGCCGGDPVDPMGKNRKQSIVPYFIRCLSDAIFTMWRKIGSCEVHLRLTFSSIHIVNENFNASIAHGLLIELHILITR